MDIFTPAGAWRRFLARTIDLNICFLFLGFIAELFLANKFKWYVEIINQPNLDKLSYLIFLPFVLILDASICSIIGTNFGKYLMNIQVLKINGKITTNDWFLRARGIWRSGFAFGFPFISIYTFWREYKNVSKGNPTKYDANLGLQVSSRKMSTRRKIGVTLILAVLLSCMVLSIEDEAELKIATQSNHYTWRNPITKIDVQISSFWKNSKYFNEDQKDIYLFDHLSGRAAIVFSEESFNALLTNMRLVS